MSVVSKGETRFPNQSNPSGQGDGLHKVTSAFPCTLEPQGQPNPPPPFPTPHFHPTPSHPTPRPFRPSTGR